MGRPFLSRVLPDRLKEKLYYTFFHTRHRKWRHLFEVAPLAACPDVAMHELIPGDVISGNIAFHGFYEWQLTQRIVDAARSGGCLVDVGANMGYFSLLWAAMHPSARVFAFEPSPRNVALLTNNVVQNGFSERITVIPKAAGDEARTLAFDPGPAEQTGWGSIFTTRAGAETRAAFHVPVVRLDEVLDGQEIAVLKIDTEGADTLVLKGAEGLLKDRKIQMIFFEQNSLMLRLGIREGEAQAFLRSYGYECNLIDEDEWIAVRSGVPALSEAPADAAAADAISQASMA